MLPGAAGHSETGFESSVKSRYTVVVESVYRKNPQPIQKVLVLQPTVPCGHAEERKSR
jgi:hypothetical protein